jgi:starch synthase
MAGKAGRAALMREFGLDSAGAAGHRRQPVDRPEGHRPAARRWCRNSSLGGGWLIVLGSGDPALEGAMRGLAAAFPGRVAVRIGYDEGLSHRLFSGADAVLVPSRFEPCGLTQMYGLRYGTLPVVSLGGRVGGYGHRASPATLAAGVATGVTFHPVDAAGLRAGDGRQLLALYRPPKLWAKLQKNAMAQPVGWETSAAAYASALRKADGVTPQTVSLPARLSGHASARASLADGGHLSPATG